MKTYAQLTKEQQQRAFIQGVNSLLEDICTMSPNTLPEELEEEIKQASKMAEENKTPWFFGEILYHEVPGAREKIRTIVQKHIEGALYLEGDEDCMRGIA